MNTEYKLNMNKLYSWNNAVALIVGDGSGFGDFDLKLLIESDQ